jgi:hypothetical protein
MRKLALFATLSLLALAPRPSHAQVRVGVALPGIRVEVGPPAPRYEPVPVAPSPRHQWIAGYWSMRTGQQAWVAGHWALPPAYGYVWEPARWEQVNGAWMYTPGHWRTSDQPDPAVAWQPPPPPVNEVVVEAAPPPPIEEIRPAVPFAGAVWIPGYWHWNGHRHVWVGGRFSPRPAGYGWEPNRWEKRQDGRWADRPGHWHPQDEGRHGGHEGKDEHHR